MSTQQKTEVQPLISELRASNVEVVGPSGFQTSSGLCIGRPKSYRMLVENCCRCHGAWRNCQRTWFDSIRAEAASTQCCFAACMNGTFRILFVAFFSDEFRSGCPGDVRAS